MFHKTLNIAFRGEAESSIEVILQWCKDHDRGKSGLFSAMAPAIAFCIQNYTKVDTEGKVTVELNLGTITIPPTNRSPWTKKTPNP